MEDYIQISKLNDFIFCPKSIYFHSVYEKYNSKMYHSVFQQRGKIKHEAIDERRYSSRKNILQGKTVYNHKYRILGKIDLFDLDTNTLIERKYKIKKIYDGYKYQVYAQYFCLQEMGYKISKIEMYSLVDNKKYNIPLPTKREITEFEDLINKIRDYQIDDYVNYYPESKSKCENCIYRELCL